MTQAKSSPSGTRETVDDYHYTIMIQWSESAKCFVVSLPEWGDFCHTYGETYEEALKNAQEVLNLMVTSCLAEGKKLPQVKTFDQSSILF